jgi:hypothetical protein
VMIAGITTLFAISLFLFTALVFSFAVLNIMRGRKKGIKMPAGGGSRCSSFPLRIQYR